MEYPKEIVPEYLAGSSTVALSKKYGFHCSSIRSYLIKNGVTLRSNKVNSKKYKADDRVFEVIDTEEKAYWLGFLYADGYVSSTNGKRIGLALSTKDYKHLEKFKSFLNSDYPISVYTSSGYSNTEYCRMIITSEKMYEDLVSHGVVEHKTNVLEYPYWLDSDLQKHFLRGYIDGDGCITNNGSSYAVKIMGTDGFLDGVVRFLTNEQAYTYGSRTQRNSECDVKCLNLFGKTAFNTITLTYGESHIYLDRKFDRATEAIRYFSRLYQQ